MSKLLNRSLKVIMLYAALILMLSIPVYYFAISVLWQYEMEEHNIVLTPEANREDVFLLILSVTALTVLFFVLLLGGFILINRNISRRLWRPFYESMEGIRKFDLNKTDLITFEPTGIDEFNELNDSLTKLISANIETYRRQKEFADNAAHELQTPLAIARSKLELLLQSTSLSSSENESIEDALQAIARAGRINKNLLLLTKIENSQFTDEVSVDLAKQIEEVITQLAYFADDKQITIDTQLAKDVRLTGNRILIEILLQNLLNNAIRHSPPATTISIVLRGDKLKVLNAGAVPLDHTRLFKRFSTASSETPGTGLGLAIIKQICSRYGWRIDYDFLQFKHCFTLIF